MATNISILMALVIAEFKFGKSFFHKTMFAKIKWVWTIVLIGTITADQGLNDHKTNCSARDAKVIQREWGTIWRVADSNLRIVLAKDALLQ